MSSTQHVVSLTVISDDEHREAIRKAVAARRALQRNDRRNRSLTTPEIAELVVGVRYVPQAGADGWWFIGRIHDAIAGVEFDVWFMPERKRIGLSRRAPADARPLAA